MTTGELGHYEMSALTGVSLLQRALRRLALNFARAGSITPRWPASGAAKRWPADYNLPHGRPGLKNQFTGRIA